MILLAVKSAQLGLEKNDTHVIFAGISQLTNVVPYAKFIYFLILDRVKDPPNPLLNPESKK